MQEATSSTGRALSPSGEGNGLPPFARPDRSTEQPLRPGRDMGRRVPGGDPAERGDEPFDSVNSDSSPADVAGVGGVDNARVWGRRERLRTPAPATQASGGGGQAEVRSGGDTGAPASEARGGQKVGPATPALVHLTARQVGGLIERITELELVVAEQAKYLTKRGIEQDRRLDAIENREEVARQARSDQGEI